MNPADRDGNAFLGIAIGLAFTATVLGLLWVVLGSGAWVWIGVFTILAAGVFFLNVIDGDER